MDETKHLETISTEGYKKNLTEDARYSLEVDFTEQEFVEDPLTVTSCYQIFASDGHRGRIDHLHQDFQPERFVRDLRKLLGADSEVRLCIVGGLDSSTVSKSLGPKLVSALEDQGFVIGGCDSGGNYARRAKMYSDRVVVSRNIIGTNQSEDIVLIF